MLNDKESKLGSNNNAREVRFLSCPFVAVNPACRKEKSNMIYFYDTCSLLNMGEKAFDIPPDVAVGISTETLKELENIKTSASKDQETKFKARHLIRALEDPKYADKLKVYCVTGDVYVTLEHMNLPITSDNLICATAYWVSKDEEVTFITDDLNCKAIQQYIFGLPSRTSEDLQNGTELYKGYTERVVTDDELVTVYQEPASNIFNCKINEYTIMYDSSNHFVDTIKWDGEAYKSIVKKNFGFESKSFGKVKPLDEIQRCAFDSINNNVITMIYGRAGSGKTTIPLAYAEAMMDKEKFSQIVFVYSYDTLKGARELGFEKGSHEEKLLNYGAIGNILATKYGDGDSVEFALTQGTIDIIPTANIRGVDFRDKFVFVTEAQNLDVYTLKTLIQRCGEGTKLVLEGDLLEQSDTSVSGSGMKRFIEVFGGTKYAGIVKLKQNYRSEFGEIADLM